MHGGFERVIYENLALYCSIGLIAAWEIDASLPDPRQELGAFVFCVHCSENNFSELENRIYALCNVLVSPHFFFLKRLSHVM
jgi:hypothetical protein